MQESNNNNKNKKKSFKVGNNKTQNSKKNNRRCTCFTYLKWVDYLNTSRQLNLFCAHRAHNIVFRIGSLHSNRNIFSCVAPSLSCVLCWLFFFPIRIGNVFFFFLFRNWNCLSLALTRCWRRVHEMSCWYELSLGFITIKNSSILIKIQKKNSGKESIQTLSEAALGRV